MLLRRHLRRLEVPLAAGEVDQAQDAAFREMAAGAWEAGGFITLSPTTMPWTDASEGGAGNTGRTTQRQRRPCSLKHENASLS